MIRDTTAARTRQAEAVEEGRPVPGMPTTFLDATKQDGKWVVERGEVDRFATSRNPRPVIHGYDITFSVPKSVSVLWAASDPAVQTIIEDAFTNSVNTGMEYLETEAFWTRNGRGEDRGRGMTAAAYRHNTSRALEPQLHDHVVVANMATTPDGQTRAVDARGFHAHATTAGHLADA